jgi:hypothetical protein
VPVNAAFPGVNETELVVKLYAKPLNASDAVRFTAPAVGLGPKFTLIVPLNVPGAKEPSVPVGFVAPKNVKDADPVVGIPVAGNPTT